MATTAISQTATSTAAVARQTTSAAASGIARGACAARATIFTWLGVNAGLTAGLAIVFVFVSWALLVALFRLCVDELAIRSFKTYLWFVFCCCLAPRLIPRPDDEAAARSRSARIAAKRDLDEARRQQRQMERRQTEALKNDRALQQRLRQEREDEERQAKENARRQQDEQVFGANEAAERAQVRQVVSSTVGGLSPVTQPDSPGSVGRPGRRWSNAEVPRRAAVLETLAD
jgi:hypothetical protein